MGNLERLTYPFNQVTIYICSIVFDDRFWYPKMTYQIVANKFGPKFLRQNFVGSSFDLLYEEIITIRINLWPLEAAGSSVSIKSIHKDENVQVEHIALSS